ncbi:hypothetical protein ECMP0215613_3240 [Escherichia coli MP021561.3]|nr:hypothetical protein ECMP0215613_3240 [Escherichia coli MP021561.3]
MPTECKNYAASAAWKAAALNILEHLTVNRRSPVSAGNTLTECSAPPALPDPVYFREKPGLHKESRGQGENRILVAAFFISILSALKF